MFTRVWQAWNGRSFPIQQHGFWVLLGRHSSYLLVGHSHAEIHIFLGWQELQSWGVYRVCWDVEGVPSGKLTFWTQKREVDGRWFSFSFRGDFQARFHVSFRECTHTFSKLRCLDSLDWCNSQAQGTKRSLGICWWLSIALGIHQWWINNSRMKSRDDCINTCRC